MKSIDPVSEPYLYIPGQNSKSKAWFVIFYAVDGDGNKQRYRETFDINRISDIPKRRKVAEQIISRIKSVLEARIAAGKPFGDQDCERLKTQISSETIGRQTDLGVLAEFVSDYVETRRDLHSKNTLRSIEARLRLLHDYAQDKLNKQAFDFEDFAHTKFPFDFRRWCYAAPRTHTINTVAKYFQVFSQILESADKRGCYKNTLYQDPNFSQASVDSDAIALTLDEVSAIASLDLSQYTEIWQRTRIWFLIGCFTGLRISDLKTLDSIAVGYHVINKKRIPILQVLNQKTYERVDIPIHPFIKKYIDHTKPNNGLPPCPSEQNLNKYVKRIANLAGINENVSLRSSKGGKMKMVTRPKCEWITNHTGRRTFASHAYFVWKLPTQLIMQLTGHRTEAQFFKYIKVQQHHAISDMLAVFERDKELFTPTKK